MSNDDSLAAQVPVLKAIADPTRLRILGLLAAHPHTGRELADALALSAPTVSHHMQRLVAVGVVTATPEATRRRYALNEALWGPLRDAPTPAPAPSADPDHQRIVRIFFDGDRLTQIPARRKARTVVLLELLRRFEAGRTYTEPEVNAVLRTAHPDVATLRRELVDYRYLTREAGQYRVATSAPGRDANEAQEVPVGESAWLRALLHGAGVGA